MATTTASRSEIFDLYTQAYDRQKQVVMSIRDYLEGCKKDPTMYATASERMLASIVGIEVRIARSGQVGDAGSSGAHRSLQEGEGFVRHHER